MYFIRSGNVNRVTEAYARRPQYVLISSSYRLTEQLQNILRRFH